MLKRINTNLGKVLNVLLIVLFTILVLDVLWGVLTRYALGGQARWTEELARLLMVWLGLLGAALVCREEKHLGLDVLVRSWHPSVQNCARLVVHACVGLFALFVMAWGGGQLVAQRMSAGQMLPALGLSKAWFYLAIPISGILILLFIIELMLGAIHEMNQKEAEQ